MNQPFLFIFFFLFSAHTTAYANTAPIKFKQTYTSWRQTHPEGQKVLLKALNLHEKEGSINTIYDKLQALEVLVIRRKKIYHLDILNYAPKITHLTVIGNPLQNISFIKNLPELRSLHLGSILQGNQISDISPLRHAKKLTDLNLNHNFIKDLDPLKGLPLETLSIRGNQVSNFEPLLHCSQLQYLYAQGNTASHWPQGVFQKLKVLELNHNDIATFPENCEFPTLTHLSMRRNQIQNFQTWPKAPNLKIVLIRNNPLSKNAQKILSSDNINWTHDWPSHHHEEVAALLQ